MGSRARACRRASMARPISALPCRDSMLQLLTPAMVVVTDERAWLLISRRAATVVASFFPAGPAVPRGVPMAWLL